MTSKPPPTAAKLREERLKAALKANLGRRKVQAKAKASKQAGEQAPHEAGADAPQQAGAAAPQQKE